MAANTKCKVTTDHEEIRGWALARGGKPAALRHLQHEDGDGPLRIHFPGNRSKNTPEEISWDDWFKKFDAAKLALLHQELTAGGEKSNFNKLVSRETVDKVEAALGGKGRSASRRRSRRSPKVVAIASLRDDKPQSDAAHSTSPRNASKKAIAAVASAVSRGRQPPMGKASRDTNS